MTATIKYDFQSASWVAIADWRDTLSGYGTTPEEVVENLRYQANKHDLWRKDAD